MNRVCTLVLMLGLNVSVLVPAAMAQGSGQLINNLAEQTGISEAQARAQVNEVFTAIKDELKQGREVRIRTFGSFYVQERDARKGRNPATGKEIQIPAKKYPRFRSSEVLKSRLNAK